jgi:DNA repair exonuclease SbcCD ATPase subunit
MGRASTVSYEQVAAAAEQMQAEGLTPTAKLIRSMLDNTGSLATIQRHVVEWRSGQRSGQSVTRILSPEIQRVVFKFIDEEVCRSNGELTQQVEEAKRDSAALVADNEEQTNLVRQLQAELADQATFRAKQDGQITRLLEELSSAREEAAAERREAELARLELSKVQARLEGHASLENELRQLRVDFEAQRQACVRAEQDAAVLKAQREILEARLAELKEVALPQTLAYGDGSGDGQASMATERTPKTTRRQARNSRESEEPSGQDPVHASSAASVPTEPGDPRQARLC